MKQKRYFHSALSVLGTESALQADTAECSRGTVREKWTLEEVRCLLFILSLESTLAIQRHTADFARFSEGLRLQ